MVFRELEKWVGEVGQELERTLTREEKHAQTQYRARTAEQQAKTLLAAQALDYQTKLHLYSQRQFEAAAWRIDPAHASSAIEAYAKRNLKGLEANHQGTLAAVSEELAGSAVEDFPELAPPFSIRELLSGR